MKLSRLTVTGNAVDGRVNNAMHQLSWCVLICMLPVGWLVFCQAVKTLSVTALSRAGSTTAAPCCGEDVAACSAADGGGATSALGTFAAGLDLDGAISV